MAKEKLEIVISAKDGFSDTFNKLNKEASNTKAAMKAAEKGSKMFLGAVIGLSAAVGAYIVHATLTAARTEVLGTAMEAVAKATGTSSKVLAEQEKIIKKQGITTQNARKILTLFMQAELDVADAAGVARVAQDLAVIAGINSSEAANTLTQAIASQEVMLLRQFGIVTTLPKVYDEYAASIGKAGKDLSETEKKQAFLNKIMIEGEKVAGTYEAAMGDAGKKLTSLPRHFEEAANSIGTYFLPAFESAIDVVTELMKAVTPENIDRWVEALKRTPIPLTVLAGAIAFGVTPALYGMAIAAWAAMLPLTPLIAAGIAVGVSFGGIISIFNRLEQQLEDIESPLHTNWTLLGQLSKGTSTLDKVTKKYLPSLHTEWSFLGLLGIVEDEHAKKIDKKVDSLKEAKKAIIAQREQEALYKQAQEGLKTATEKATESLEKLTEARKKDRDAQMGLIDASFNLRSAILDEADAYDAWVKIQKEGKQETREGQRALLSYERSIEGRKRAEIEAAEVTETAMAASKEAVNAFVDNWIDQQNVVPEIAEEMSEKVKKWLTGDIPDKTMQSYIKGILLLENVPPTEAGKIAKEVLDKLRVDATSEGENVDMTFANALKAGQAREVSRTVALGIKSILGFDAYAEGTRVGRTFGEGLGTSLSIAGRNVASNVANIINRMRGAEQFGPPAPPRQLGGEIPGSPSQGFPTITHGGEGILTAPTLSELRTLGIPLMAPSPAVVESEPHIHPIFLDGRELTENVNYHNSGVSDNL